jgi:uncharacterized membrane protein YeaQ/YmgE (transglycosylase-associated protein family)
MKLDLPGRIRLDLPDSVLDPAVPVGVLGVVLALAGARFYRLAIVAPGFALGVLAGLQVPGGQETRLVAALALGIIGAAVLHLLERFAVRVGGAFLTAGLAQVAAPLVTGQPNEWYIPVAGGVVGLFLFPSLYKKLLPVITAIMGGLCVAWSVGAGEDLRVVGSVAAIGVVVQLASGARGKGGGDKDD